MDWVYWLRDFIDEEFIVEERIVDLSVKKILKHIIKSYNYYGIREFIVCCGYKGYLIKEYFANYFLHMNDLEIEDIAIKEGMITLRKYGIELVKLNLTTVDELERVCKIYWKKVYYLILTIFK